MGVFMYVGVSSPDASVWLGSEGGDMSIEGYDPHFGRFRLRTEAVLGSDEDIACDGTSSSASTTYYFSNRTETPFFVTDANFLNLMIHGVDDKTSPACCTPWNHRRLLPNLAFHKNPNLVVLQKILMTPFSWTVRFERVSESSSEDGDLALEATYVEKFEKRFMEAFPMPEHLQEFGLQVLSSLLSGLGYYDGTAYYKTPSGEVEKFPSPRRLLTFTPCKRGFPRGFYWDESWHQLVVSRMYPKLHETIVEYWYELQNATTGWIAREQVIGDEALQMCPRWAWADSVLNMNPPSFFLTHWDYCKRRCGTNETTRKFFLRIFPKLERTLRWYLYYTQSEKYPSAFHWNGRMGDGSYDSGLDDFPRADGGLQPGELNVDLQSWIGMATMALSNIAASIGLTERHTYWQSVHEKILGVLSSRFWNPKKEFYTDVTDAGFVEYIGVIGLLPFCLGLESNHSRVSRTLQLLEDPEVFFDVSGITSLSKSSKCYVPGDGNYWRGNIWLNQQYVCLKALKEIEGQFPAAKALRKKFQAGITDTMLENFGRYDGGIYETYHPETRKGYNHLPFTGWSSLILLIMSEEY